MCLFPEENQQPVLGGNLFSEEKWQFSLDVKQQHTFFRQKSTKKIAKVSPSNNNYSFRITKPFNNNNNNTIWRGIRLSRKNPSHFAGFMVQSRPRVWRRLRSVVHSSSSFPDPKRRSVLIRMIGVTFLIKSGLGWDDSRGLCRRTSPGLHALN